MDRQYSEKEVKSILSSFVQFLSVYQDPEDSYDFNKLYRKFKKEWPPKKKDPGVGINGWRSHQKKIHWPNFRWPYQDPDGSRIAIGWSKPNRIRFIL